MTSGMPASRKASKPAPIASFVTTSSALLRSSSMPYSATTSRAPARAASLMTSLVLSIVWKLPAPSSPLTSRTMFLSTILDRKRDGIRSMNCSPRRILATFMSSKTRSPPGRPRPAPVTTTGSLVPQPGPLGAGAAPSGPGWGTNEPVVVTGAGLGLPGGERVFDDMNVAKILRGEQFIDLIPSRFRSRMVDKNIVRLVKGEDGAGSFQTIDNTSEVIKLAARAGALDVVAEYGIDEERNKALDVVTKLAIGAGFDALRDAGIPLVMHYKTTSIGTQLATRWALPDAMRDDTGVI